MSFRTNFWLFTKCWIWQQCCNCEQHHSKTLQSKAELTQIDILVHKPDHNLSGSQDVNNHFWFLKAPIFSKRVARFWLRIKIDKKCQYECLFYPKKDNLQHYIWNFYCEKIGSFRNQNWFLASREQDKYSCILDFF